MNDSFFRPFYFNIFSPLDFLGNFRLSCGGERQLSLECLNIISNLNVSLRHFSRGHFWWRYFFIYIYFFACLLADTWREATDEFLFFSSLRFFGRGVETFDVKECV